MPQMSYVLREREIGMLTAGVCTRAVTHELNVHFSTISRLQRHFRGFGSTSNRPHNRRPRVTTPAQDLQDRLRPSTRTVAATIGLHNQRISVRNRLRDAHLHARCPHRGLDLTSSSLWQTWVGKCSHSMMSGPLERYSLHGWIPVFTVQGRWQTACMASCGWAVCWCQHCGSSGPWWRWGYGMGRRMLWTTNTGAFYWWHFEYDTLMRSWGPLLCHSSTTVTSCCSMMIHGPMLQGSVHNSWKLKTSQFLHGQHTHQTRHPLSTFGMLWIGVYDSVFQFLPISSNFAQPLKRSGPTFHRP